MKHAPLLIVTGQIALTLMCVSAVPGASIEFSCGPMMLSFDENNGDLTRMTCQGRGIARVEHDVPPVTFGVGPADKVTWFEQIAFSRKLVKQTRPSPDRLELTISAGPYELVESYRLYLDAARVDRSVQLVNRGPDTLRLRGLAFRTSGLVATELGFYRFPAAWPPRSHRFAEMQPGRKAYSRGTIAPALAELSSSQSLLWTSFTEDNPGLEVTEDRGRFDVRQTVAACGYLRPNDAQDFGFVSLQVIEGNYWTALGRLWAWMDSVALRVPEDRPEWVPGGILYSYHPGGTIGSGFNDLGGFSAATEKLLPTLPRLGVKAIWILPVESRSPYWPFDYYQFAEGLGDAAQFRQLVAKAHELNLRVWQDLVPHGGSPQAVHNLAHPEFMLVREDSSHLDYWLNDFKLPAWQHYIADVAAHYMTNYDLDGFRVDACGGSREPNWSTNIPYARASLAMMQGGLEMMNGIRAEVRRANPRHGAVLAEVESARQAAVSDVQYDFTFCYTLCRSWNRMEAGPFVDALQDYLEEQRLSEPRGTVRLRHVESHDSLRAQGWYGVQGLRAFYALSAWIDGMPMIYQGMEDGHAFALAEINRVRRERPELSRGGALYRAVHCDVPGVFTCLRKLGDRSSVVVINFNREPVRANLGWPGGKATLALARLEYAVVPESASGPSGPAASERREQGEVAGSELHATLPDETPFVDATEWFVDTIEGRLHDEFPGPRTSGAVGSGGIYWRPQGRGVLWQHALTPLHPDHPLLGFKGRNGLWRVYEFSGEITNPVRLAERGPSGTGLRLLGADGLTARVTKMPQLPPEPDFAADVRRGGVALRCVGSRYIISNAYFRLELRRQGGVLRQLRAGSDVLAENQDFYGDQAYFITQPNARIDASSDVECAVSVRAEVDGFRLRFEGQLRDDGRFALKWPPLWYRNEYVFTSAPRFTKRWAFRTEKAFHSQQAFLSFYVGQVAAERFCFERTGRTLTEGPVVAGSAARQGQTQGPPDAVAFGRSEKPSWSLTGLKVPPVADVHAFLQGHMLFLPLLDGDESSLPDDHWQEFEATWDLPH